MGKKGRKRSIDDNEVIQGDIVPPEDDPELLAEIEAVKAIHKEKVHGENETGKDDKKSNESGLVQSIKNMPTRLLSFKESFQICEFELAGTTDENDDLQRETNFYDHTLLAVNFGRDLLKKSSIPFIRPNDYFCEHVKSDQHMDRIKDRLILEERKISAVEQRKQREQNRKFAKKVSKVAKTEGKDNPRARSKETPATATTELGGRNDKPKSPGSFKRKAMDKKYGFGGRDRKRMKLTDQKSLNDLSDFNPKGGKFVRRGPPGAKKPYSAGKSRPPAAKGSKQRPGKAVRTKMRKSRSS